MKSKIQILLAMFSMLVMVSATVMLSGVEAYAQVPQLFNYQGIARDAKGNPLSNQTMTLKLSVLPTSDASVAEYEETQTVKTNEFGLYTLQIGNGTAVTGAMKTVKWETGNKYIKVGIDPNGGNNFVDAGTNQLLSVPYAIYADKAGVAANGGTDKTRTGAVNSEAAHVAGDNRYLTRFYGLNLIGKSALYESAAGNIGLGTITPGGKFSIYANSATNFEHLRLQNVSATGSGKFIMYNDGLSSYATFTKYGSAVAGDQIPGLYPNANTLAFGNNGTVAGDGLGKFLISTGGNLGLAILKGTSKLKFHVDYTSENVGIGGNSTPVSRVHFNNTDGTTTDLRLTNNTTGHLVGDGLEIKNVGNNASIINKEAGDLSLGSSDATAMTIIANNNVGIGTTIPSHNLEINLNKNSKTNDSVDVSELLVKLGNAGEVLNGGVGLGFGNSSVPENIGAAIMFERTGSQSNGDLHFATKNTGVFGGDIPIRMTLNQNGNLGIGTTTPNNSRLHVVGSTDTAVYATTTSGSSVQVAIYGNQSNGAFGAGIVGRGFGGAGTIPSSRDIGVYGSSSDIAIWSQGKLKVVDGTEGSGKVLTSDANGTASWRTNIGFNASSTTIVNIASGASLTRVYGNVNFNDGGAYNNATGTFTVPVAGVYQFNYSENFSAVASTSGHAALKLQVNGIDAPTSAARVQPGGATSLNWGIENSVTLKLNAGDLVTVLVLNASIGVNLVTTGFNQNGGFSGFRVY
jgi:hypothetical protein